LNRNELRIFQSAHLGSIQPALTIDRITYEICVLEAVREQLRCKEVWVAGANRYRNPDEDLPADFDAQRTAHYQALGLPLDAGVFINVCRRKCAAHWPSSTRACRATRTSASPASAGVGSA